MKRSRADDMDLGLSNNQRPRVDEFSFEPIPDDPYLKDVYVRQLQRQLGHLRTWMLTVFNKLHQTNPQAVKNTKRLYVGNLTHDTSEEELRQFLEVTLVRVGGSISSGSPILSCRVMQDKNYAFVEFRSIEETSNAMALDGVMFKENPLKVRRPTGYDVNIGLLLGPVDPDTRLDLSSVTRKPGTEESHKLFIAGFPHEWTEAQVKELLEPYGSLQAFNMVMEKGSGQSKGYAFCDFSDEEAANAAIKGLHGSSIGARSITVQFAKEGQGKGSETQVPDFSNSYPPLRSLASELFNISNSVEDGPNKLFIGGLPNEFTADQVIEALLAFGPLKAFNLVVDKQTGKSKGYAFCEFLDPRLTDLAIHSLHGSTVGNRTITVKPAQGQSKQGGTTRNQGNVGGSFASPPGNLGLAPRLGLSNVPGVAQRFQQPQGGAGEQLLALSQSYGVGAPAGGAAYPKVMDYLPPDATQHLGGLALPQGYQLVNIAQFADQQAMLRAINSVGPRAG